ncbi:MAG: cytidine deaminase [Oscillospiraceae bacterium]|nr:cytidine deaminase [Oscillospiraceae bacterium]
MTDKELVLTAIKAKDNAWAPYSGFHVGAAILCESGEVFTGCNVENSSYGATICAERTAAVKAVSEGKRNFSCIAVVSDADEYCMPCGICRQFLADIAPSLRFLLAKPSGEYKVSSMEELLPGAFRLEKK